MKKVLAVVLGCLLGSACAHAQSTPITAVPPPTLTFEVTPEEADLIGKALGTLPYSEVAGLFQKLKTQAARQRKQTESPPKEQ